MATLTRSEAEELESLAREVESSRPRAARALRRILRSVTRPEADALLTTGEAAELLGVSEQTVRNWVDAGWLPAYRRHRLGRRMIPESGLAAVRAFDAARLKPKAELSEEGAVELVREHRRSRT